MREFTANGVKEAINFLGFSTALIFGEQGIVRFIFISPVVCFLASDFEEFLKVGGEGGEVVFFSSLAPSTFGK